MDKLMNKYTLLSILAVMPALSHAQPAEFKATVQVTNSFNFVKVNDLDFGTIRASGDPAGAETATLTVAANAATAPTVTSTNANLASIAVINPGSPASFTVDGVAPFSTLTITDPTNTTVSPTNLPPGTPGFLLSNFTYYMTSGTPGPVTGTIQVDSDGTVAFNVGATLTTTSAATGNYLNGTYEGSFTLELNY
ncbi:DUF4402 domain-containing protein [Pseudoalteromonas rubra]|uniref:DUF4402 domain-containing protein n=1 Tax=Pseudoalteromonas rubra TaxID=43658 RepID=A0A0F4QYC1_9GAMM|nr:DUF4402 domain-containing protein [Pseudoalteromonas rubra]KJZ12339.1 hypothetical protein TW77_02960 [Pseudoalteromonas rubra]